MGHYFVYASMVIFIFTKWFELVGCYCVAVILRTENIRFFSKPSWSIISYWSTDPSLIHHLSISETTFSPNCHTGIWFLGSHRQNIQFCRCHVSTNSLSMWLRNIPVRRIWSWTGLFRSGSCVWDITHTFAFVVRVVLGRVSCKSQCGSLSLCLHHQR